jgi:hypothetical protein
MPDVPIRFVWSGGVMRPTDYYAEAAKAMFVEGQTYRLVAAKERSERSHSFFFACVAAAHENLPEWLAPSFPTATHLRKHALIRAGFCETQEFIADSEKEARRLAAFIRPFDEYAMILVRGNVVTVLTAKSQSKADMKPAEFESSKRGVLNVIAGMIGVSPEELLKERQQ